jgi:hypothetical protein
MSINPFNSIKKVVYGFRYQIQNALAATPDLNFFEMTEIMIPVKKSQMTIGSFIIKIREAPPTEKG